MSPDLEALGRRAVACPRWRWMPGMVAVVPSLHDGATGHTMRLTESQVKGKGLRPDLYPILTDPATLGCLLALVREATHRQWPLVVVNLGSYCQVGFVAGGEWFSPFGGCYSTEAAALVAALEAAP